MSRSIAETESRFTTPAIIFRNEVQVALTSASPTERKAMAATYMDALERVASAPSMAARQVALRGLGEHGTFAHTLAKWTDDAFYLLFAGAGAFIGTVDPKLSAKVWAACDSAQRAVHQR
jgi:hypothetical protein